MMYFIQYKKRKNKKIFLFVIGLICIVSCIILILISNAKKKNLSSTSERVIEWTGIHHGDEKSREYYDHNPQKLKKIIYCNGSLIQFSPEGKLELLFSKYNDDKNSFVPPPAILLFNQNEEFYKHIELPSSFPKVEIEELLTPTKIKNMSDLSPQGYLKRKELVFDSERRVYETMLENKKFIYYSSEPWVEAYDNGILKQNYNSLNIVLTDEEEKDYTTRNIEKSQKQEEILNQLKKSQKEEVYLKAGLRSAAWDIKEFKIKFKNALKICKRESEFERYIEYNSPECPFYYQHKDEYPAPNEKVRIFNNGIKEYYKNDKLIQMDYPQDKMSYKLITDTNGQTRYIWEFSEDKKDNSS